MTKLDVLNRFVLFFFPVNRSSRGKFKKVDEIGRKVQNKAQQSVKISEGRINDHKGNYNLSIDQG